MPKPPEGLIYLSFVDDASIEAGRIELSRVRHLRPGQNDLHLVAALNKLDDPVAFADLLPYFRTKVTECFGSDNQGWQFSLPEFCLALSDKDYDQPWVLALVRELLVLSDELKFHVKSKMAIESAHAPTSPD